MRAQKFPEVGAAREKFILRHEAGLNAADAKV
jgi:hypothetical protein